MPLFFGYSNAYLLKSKAEDAADEVIDHLKRYGLKKAYELKPHLDTYYKYNNSWKSNFCFLYKECNYSPSELLNMLMDNTKTQYRKYRKGLLSEIQKKIENDRYIDLLSGFDKKEVPEYKGKGLSENDRKTLTNDRDRCGGPGQKLAWIAIRNAADEIESGYLQGDYNLIYSLWSEELITFKNGYYKNIAVQMTKFHTAIDKTNANKLTEELKGRLESLPHVYDAIYAMFRNADDNQIRNAMTDSYNDLAEERLEQQKEEHDIGCDEILLENYEEAMIVKFITAWHYSTIERYYICEKFMELKKGKFADFLVDILETVNDTLHTNRNPQNKNKKKV